MRKAFSTLLLLEVLCVVFLGLGLADLTDQAGLVRLQFISSNYNYDSEPGQPTTQTGNCSVTPSVPFEQAAVCSSARHQNYSCSVTESYDFSGRLGTWAAYQYAAVLVEVEMSAMPASAKLKVNVSAVSFPLVFHVEGIDTKIPDGSWDTAGNNCSPAFCMHPNRTYNKCPSQIPFPIHIAIPVSASPEGTTTVSIDVRALLKNSQAGWLKLWIDALPESGSRALYNTATIFNYRVESSLAAPCLCFTAKQLQETEWGAEPKCTNVIHGIMSFVTLSGGGN